MAPVRSKRASDGELELPRQSEIREASRHDAATACLCQKRYVDRVPEHVAVLETAEPYRAYSLYLAHAFPSALRPTGFFDATGELASYIPRRGSRRASG